ncbi:energy transducer TonB, partial [Aquabacterium sp.]|uniref:energy transducer TonB n=1 Tax=Aquabacterium sp. TaxID=1872578 RepID=UPI0025BDB909
APVVVPYPDGVVAHSGRLTLQLAVYIDENGHVRRTEPVGERLEAAFERAANDAFLQARFRPGERQGQAVKTRLLIELAFEALPADAARGMRLSAAGGLPAPTETHTLAR